MNSNSPKVSIFMISYNQATLIEEAVLSCLAQDYSNIEIVISDDGSTDGTAEILAAFKDKHPDKINLILNPVNQGIVKNSNVALSNCSGEFVAFMGGDDILYPTKISRQVEAFIADPEVVFCYHPCHILKNGVITGTVGDRAKDVVTNFYEMMANYGAQIPGPVPMVARAAIPAGGFNEKISTACDWLLFIEISSKGKVIRLDEVLSIYRKHDNNIGHKIFSYADNFLQTLDLVEEKYGKDPKVVAACNKGRKRFLLGIIYNAILVKNKEALTKYVEIYKKSGGNAPRLIYALGSLPFSSWLFRSIKNSLKKIF